MPFFFQVFNGLSGLCFLIDPFQLNYIKKKRRKNEDVFLLNLVKIHQLVIHSKSITKTKASSSEEQVKRRDESKQHASWDPALVCKSLNSQTACVLVLNTYCIFVLLRLLESKQYRATK